MIERQDVGGVAVVRLAHGKVNALDLELLQTITATFRELDQADNTAIVLTGSRPGLLGRRRPLAARRRRSRLCAFLPARVECGVPGRVLFR